MHPSGRSGRFTLHVRLTKGCNADCPYCSSFSPNASGRMRPESFKAAVDWLAGDLMPRLGVGGPRDFLSVEYVGGEILTVPHRELEANVLYARERFGRLFGTVRDGVQSNLIASEARVSALDILFEGRIGTSVETTGARRTVRGSAAVYAGISARSVERIRRRRGRMPGAIFVVDREGVSGLGQEVRTADGQGRDLVLRPVFQGGSAVESADRPVIVREMVEAFRGWAMKGRASVEPFRHLLSSRVNGASRGGACPFQRNCAETSLDLEPDGKLHVCLDMADSGQVPLGDALKREFDMEAWERLRARTTTLDAKCRSCEWLHACQGGCMSEAIRDTGSPYGRPHLCDLWTALFREIDALVAREGKAAVSAWVAAI